MATTQITHINGYLKRRYIGPIRDQLNNATVLFNRLDKNEEDVHGEDLIARIPLFHERNQGIGWVAEGGTLPTAGRRKHTQSTVSMAHLYGRIQVSGQSIKASKNSSTAFAKVVTNEVRGMVEGAKIEVNRSLWGDGSGSMAKITEASGSVTGDVLFSVDDASRLEVGMTVDTYAAKTGGSVTLDSKVISEVDDLNNKISLSTTETVTLNDLIFRQDSRGLLMMGIEGIVDGLDSSSARVVTTLQGINRSTAGNKFWDATVLDNAGVNRAISTNLIQQAFELGEFRAQGRTSLIMSNLGARRSWLDLVTADKRYSNTLTLDGGWKALEYTGGGGSVPWVVDRMALANRIFFLDERTLGIYRAADFDWMDADGAVLSRVTDKDEYSGTLFCYMNLGTSGPSKNTVLRDVA